MLDDLRHWVWALSQSWQSNDGDGYNIGYLAPGHQKVDQAALETIDSELEAEEILNAQHQLWYWMFIDGAADAIGMMEADGYNLSNEGKLSKASFSNADQKRAQEAYISRVKTRVERVKSQYRNVPLGYDAVANDPEQHAEAVRGLNATNEKILNANNWPMVRDAVIHDAAAYGSGVAYTPYRPAMAVPDDTWFEEKIRQGAPLEWEEYKQFHHLVKQIGIEHIDTFELIRDRRARGEASRDINNPVHRITTWPQQKSVSWLRQKYPKYAERIHPAVADVYRDTNPAALEMGDDHQTATLKKTWIRFPVSYDLEVPVHVGGGQIAFRKKRRERWCIVEIDRIEGVGIVDMCIDKYAHNQVPLDQFVPVVSKKHSCGIGLAKYGRDADRIWNIMLNGQLRFFSRMVKGGGFYIKGAIDADAINARTQENTWIGIDLKKVPKQLHGFPFKDLVVDNRPSTMPAVYDQLMARAEEAGNRAMSVPDATLGIKQGNSGRQEMILREQAEQVMSTGIAAFEAMHHPLGIKMHSNIVQFLGDEEIMFTIKDEHGQDTVVELNKVMSMYPVTDPITQEEKLMPGLVRNELKGLLYTTQISTRSVMPLNPTERQLFFQDFTNQVVIPLMERGSKGLVALKYLNKHGYGNIPGTESMIEELQAIEAAQSEAMASQQQQAQAREDADKDREQANKQKEMALDELRHNMKHTSDMQKNLIAARGG